MNKKSIVLALIALVVLFVAFNLWMPGSVPAGQQALLELSPTSATQFDAAFDADAAATHLVLLLSPT